MINYASFKSTLHVRIWKNSFHKLYTIMGYNNPIIIKNFHNIIPKIKMVIMQCLKKAYSKHLQLPSPITSHSNATYKYPPQIMQSLRHRDKKYLTQNTSMRHSGLWPSLPRHCLHTLLGSAGKTTLEFMMVCDWRCKIYYHQCSQHSNGQQQGHASSAMHNVFMKNIVFLSLSINSTEHIWLEHRRMTVSLQE